jgi:hypothetical protein
MEATTTRRRAFFRRWQRKSQLRYVEKGSLSLARSLSLSLLSCLHCTVEYSKERTPTISTRRTAQRVLYSVADSLHSAVPWLALLLSPGGILTQHAHRIRA